MKCEVLDNCVLAVGKGSIVEVSQRQYELARKILRPIEAKKEVKTVVEEVKPFETAEQPKAKQTRKKK